jgi:hypothetical protein
MAQDGGATSSDHSQRTLLGIYLNDHLAGATAGVEPGAPDCQACRGSANGGALDTLARDIAEDRAALVEITRTLGIPVRRYKIYVAWVGEKVGRPQAQRLPPPPFPTEHAGGTGDAAGRR